MQRSHLLTTAAVSLLALALAGCNKSGSSQDMAAVNANSGLPALPAALPMQAGAPAAVGSAPPVTALSAPRDVGLGRFGDRGDAYAYLDRASDIEDEIGDAPPDYAYDDDGVSPWVWETDGGDLQYAEPYDGGYRYYYYEPGADEPYLIRDNRYSYAFAGGALVAIYALNGALLPSDQYAAHRAYASRYYWHAQQLRQAAQTDPHRGVYAANWAARQGTINAARSKWVAARASQPDWQNYHAQHDMAQQQNWQMQRQQRQAEARQFTAWQSHGFAGPPPQVAAHAASRPPAAPPGNPPRPALTAGHPLPAPGEVQHPQVAPGAMAGPPALDHRPPAAAPHPAGPEHLAPHPPAPAPIGAAPSANRPEHQQQEQAREQALAAQQHAHAAAAAQNVAHQNALAAEHAAEQQQSVAAQAHREALVAAHQQAAARAAPELRPNAMPAHEHIAPPAPREMPHSAPAPRPEAPHPAPAPHLEAPHPAPAARPEPPHPAPPRGDEHHQP